MTSNFTVFPAAPESPVILHVPHSARTIPPKVRADLLLSDEELEAELDEATDTATAMIAAIGAKRAHHRPAVMGNNLSRLVVDPERFPNESEPAAAFGRGAVYTRTCSGAPLRDEPYLRATALLDAYFRPYAAALTEVVGDRLSICGRAVVIDVHSYPGSPSSFEDTALSRPALCIGTDPAHTPHWLRDATRDAFALLGDIAVNTPYAGCYVPLRYYGVDPRVSSVMIELRRDTYLNTPSLPDLDRTDQLGRALAQLIDTVTERLADV